MRRRTYLIAGVMVALAGYVTGYVYFSRPGPGVTWANVERIQVGMTQPEVEAVVGWPPQTSWGCRNCPITDNSPPEFDTVLLWSDMECDILVYLNEDGRVVAREGVGSKPPTWHQRLRKRMGL